MVEYSKVNVKLSDSKLSDYQINQIIRLKSTIKVQTGVVFKNKCQNV